MTKAVNRPGPKKGYRQTPEHRAKIAASMLGQKRTPEQCANISAGKRSATPTYTAVHKRMGSPRIHQCSCGKRADVWAYQHTCPDPIYDPSGRPYSTSPSDYKPMCHKCHNDLDGVEARRAADGTFR